VGDAEFQKKCLGKMNEVSREKGRTILFVSHNMQAVRQLCNKALWLHKGKEAGIGSAHDVINQYITSVRKNRLGQEWTYDEAPGAGSIRIKSVALDPQLADDFDGIDVRTPLTFKAKFWNAVEGQHLHLSLRLFHYGGDCIFEINTPSRKLGKGLVEATAQIPGHFLNDGSYYLSLVVLKDGFTPVFQLEECISFDVADYRESASLYTKWMGAVRPSFPFSIKEAMDVKENLYLR
jgi:lipopolysaccharide transport system ATP-binding protein